MDAIVGVWLTSIIGAGAFSVVGYVVGQRGTAAAVTKARDDARAAAATLPAPMPVVATPLPASITPLDSSRNASLEVPTPLALPVSALASQMSDQLSSSTLPDAPPVRSATPPPPLSSQETPVMPGVMTGTPSNRPPGRYSKTPRAFDATKDGPIGDGDDEEEDDRPTLVPDTLTHAAVLAAASATIPPLRAPSIKVGNERFGGQQEDVEGIKSELRAALVRAESASQRARAAEVVRSELERQLENVRSELKQELVARANAESRAEELGDRLVSASEEASSLRHKVSLLDKQSKQLREALQGRVRALTTSEWHRRRDLEDAEEIRVKLRDVYDKIGSSLPPDAPSSSVPPGSTHVSSPGMPAAPRSGGSGGSGQYGAAMSGSGGSGQYGVSSVDDDVNALVNSLRQEVTRLSSENTALRARTSVANTPTQRRLPSRDSAPDLDLDVYRDMIARVATVAGLRGAVVADELGSVLVGNGELAEALAAFGAYIKDAGSRTDQLLPLEGVDEIDIRDRTGMLFCARVITTSPTELSLVLLGSAEQSITAAKKIVDEAMRLRG